MSFISKQTNQLEITRIAANAPQFGSSGKLRKHEISQALQIHLDIDNLLEGFTDEVSHDLKISGIQYVNNDISHQFKWGNIGKHSCAYDLIFENDNLGKITFSHEKRFLSNHLKILENLSCGLFIPLKNAIRFHKTLSAAQIDRNTGIRKQKAFHESFKKAFWIAKRYDQPLHVILINFKLFINNVNPQGNLATQQNIIKTASEILLTHIKNKNQIFCYDENGFAIIVQDTALKNIIKLNKLIQLSLNQQYFISQHHTVAFNALNTIVCMHHDQSFIEFEQQIDDEYAFHNLNQLQHLACM